MNMIAANDHVIVKLKLESEETRKSGIVLPSTVKKEPQAYGTIVSIGPKVEDTYDIGDIIMCHKSAGQDIIFEDVIYKVLKEPEIYCRIEG